MHGSSAWPALLRQALLRTMVGALAIAGSGCSLIFTRGPALDRQPPEPCTPSNGYAVADTALAIVSVAAVVVGSIAVAEGSKPKSNDAGEALTGLGLIGTGVVGTAIFVPSAVVGYNRAAACRAWLEIPSPIVPSTPRASDAWGWGSRGRAKAPR